MEHIDQLAKKLRAVDFDLSRLSEDECAQTFDLARAAGVQLWRRGLAWPSSPGADERGGAVTPSYPTTL